MIDHMGIAISDIEVSKAFYTAALAPLGLTLNMTATPEQTESGGTAHGFGKDGGAFFWIADGERVGQGTHIAFEAETHAAVRAFYDAAIAAGGKDHGAPGPRPNYGPNYYAAFVLDPDGVNVEAVCYAE
jgi:catechol 2,3-dioxygenase-like lactoylglutathione lyase family enzyme